MFVYKLNGYGFESRFCHLNFRYRPCFEQGIPRHSGNYSVWIQSEMRTLHDKNIQLEKVIKQFKKRTCSKLINNSVHPLR